MTVYIVFLYIDIDVDKVAKGTVGCTGADLENIVNQAALKAAIDNCDDVCMSHLEFAKDKVLMGKKFPNCLCVNTISHLKLLLWSARPNSPTYRQDCTIFYMQLNHVYK